MKTHIRKPDTTETYCGKGEFTGTISYGKADSMNFAGKELCKSCAKLAKIKK